MMSFSDAFAGLGFDLTKPGTLVPFVQASCGMTSLTDKNADGFKDGLYFGLGAGCRATLKGKVACLASIRYGFNKYKSFEVADVNWVNRSDIKGNYLVATVGITYKVR